MCPWCFIEEKDIVCQYDDIKDLVGEENMPAFDLVRKVVECNHPVGQYRYNVEDAGRHSDTTNCVDRATAIRLCLVSANTSKAAGGLPARASTFQEREVLSSDTGHQQWGSEQPSH